LPIIVKHLAHHRNGVMGTGFYSVLFSVKDSSMRGVTLHASVFPERGHVAIHDVALLASGEVAFGTNSWRGDVYEPELREAIVRQFGPEDDGKDAEPVASELTP